MQFQAESVLHFCRHAFSQNKTNTAMPTMRKNAMPFRILGKRHSKVQFMR